MFKLLSMFLYVRFASMRWLAKVDSVVECNAFVCSMYQCFCFVGSSISNAVSCFFNFMGYFFNLVIDISQCYEFVNFVFVCCLFFILLKCLLIIIDLLITEMAKTHSRITKHNCFTYNKHFTHRMTGYPQL